MSVLFSEGLGLLTLLWETHLKNNKHFEIMHNNSYKRYKNSGDLIKGFLNIYLHSSKSNRLWNKNLCNLQIKPNIPEQYYALTVARIYVLQIVEKWIILYRMGPP